MAEDKKYTVSIPLKCPYIRQEQKTKFSVMMNWNANAAWNEQAKENKPPMLQINFNSVALKIETSFMCRRNRFLSEISGQCKVNESLTIAKHNTFDWNNDFFE